MGDAKQEVEINRMNCSLDMHATKTSNGDCCFIYRTTNVLSDCS